MPWYRPVRPRDNGSGYIRIWAPSNPQADRSKHVYEHILIASRALGRPLPKGSEVHHVNEDGTDNSPWNLVICENAAYHKLLHRRTKAYLACGDPTYRQCQFCGRWSPPDSPGFYAPVKQAYHKSCRLAALKLKKLRRCQDGMVPNSSQVYSKADAQQPMRAVLPTVLSEESRRETGDYGNLYRAREDAGGFPVERWTPPEYPL